MKLLIMGYQYTALHIMLILCLRLTTANLENEQLASEEMDTKAFITCKSLWFHVPSETSMSSTLLETSSSIEMVTTKPKRESAENAKKDCLRTRTINNDEVDCFLLKVAKYITETQRDEVKVKNFKKVNDNGVLFETWNGSFQSLSSIRRVGDSYLEEENNTTFLTLTTKLEEANLRSKYIVHQFFTIAKGDLTGVVEYAAANMRFSVVREKLTLKSLEVIVKNIMVTINHATIFGDAICSEIVKHVENQSDALMSRIKNELTEYTEEVLRYFTFPLTGNCN